MLKTRHSSCLKLSIYTDVSEHSITIQHNTYLTSAKKTDSSLVYRTKTKQLSCRFCSNILFTACETAQQSHTVSETGRSTVYVC